MSEAKNGEYVDTRLIEGIAMLVVSTFANKSGTDTEELQLLIDNREKILSLCAEIDKLQMTHLSSTVKSRDSQRKMNLEKTSSLSLHLLYTWKGFIMNACDAADVSKQEAVMGKLIRAASVTFPLMRECFEKMGSSATTEDEAHLMTLELQRLKPEILSLFESLQTMSDSPTRESLVAHAAQIRSLARKCELTHITKTQAHQRDITLNRLANMDDSQDKLVMFTRLMMFATMQGKGVEGLYFLVSAMPVIAALLPEEEPTAEAPMVH